VFNAKMKFVISYDVKMHQLAVLVH